MPIESCPSELKVSISKFIGRMTQTFLGSCVYPRLGFNLPMLCKSLRATISMSVWGGKDVSRKWSNLSVYCFGSSEIRPQVDILVRLKNLVPPVEPMLHHRSIRCRPFTPTPYQRSNRWHSLVNPREKPSLYTPPVYAPKTTGYTGAPHWCNRCLCVDSHSNHFKSSQNYTDA